MKALRGHNAQMVLIRLNPIIRGWSAYYRHCVSARVFNELDDHVWKLTYKWAKWTHPHKGKRWIVRGTSAAFNPARRDRWVFGDRDSGAYLLKFAWTKITRHTLVKGWASPDDPALASYWAARRRRGTPPLDRARLRLLQRQRGRCPLCGGLLLHADQEPQHPDEWEQWITAPSARRSASQAIALDAGPGTAGRTRRTPPHPHPLPTPPRQTAQAVDQHSCTLTRRLQGLPEPGARKRRTAGSEGAAAQQCAAATRLEAGVLPAGSGRAGLRAVQRRAGQGTARAARRPTGSTRSGSPRSPSGSMLRPSFVPPEEIRRLRDPHPLPRHLVQARTAEKQRVEKLLEDGHLKLSVVITDIHGVSGRDMLAALIAGQRDPKVLAELARGAMRGKIAPAGGGAGLLVLHRQHAACWR